MFTVKFEDYFERVPRYSAIQSYLPTTDRPYQSYEFLAMELTVLRLIEWDLCVPTAAHFLPYFLQVCINIIINRE